MATNISRDTTNIHIIDNFMIINHGNVHAIGYPDDYTPPKSRKKASFQW